MVRIDVDSKRVSYQMVLQKKLTVIRGDSGKGKTLFTKLVSSKSAGVKVSISDSSYGLLVVNDNLWDAAFDTLVESSNKYIYIFDDVDFVFTKRFFSLFKKDTTSFYLIINRFERKDMRSLGGIPFCVMDVFRMECSGRKHYMVPYYELDKLSDPHMGYDIVVTEDSEFGLRFLRAYNSCVSSSKGRDRLLSFLVANKDGLRNKRVLLFVDLAAVGAVFDTMLRYATVYKMRIAIPWGYLSFEYLLLRSNFYKFDLDSISNEEMLFFSSHEKLCEALIKRLSDGKPYSYSKDIQGNCYLLNCCYKHQMRDFVCDRGISGDKLNELFVGTKYQSLMMELQSSSLVLLS